jgi:nicotinate-nucleotide adenylyltransferase
MALYGGTFDPFHNGHRAICEVVLSHERVNQLRLIPCNVPALKPESRASGQQRLVMLNCWKESIPASMSAKTIVDAIELEREGPSYTADTIDTVKQQFPEYQLVFVLGADSWNSLSKWYRFDDLKQEVSFWVFSRKGDSPIHDIVGMNKCESFDELCASGAQQYWVDERVQLNVSSSSIRQAKERTREVLPEAVFNYINERGLYASINEPNK